MKHGSLTWTEIRSLCGRLRTYQQPIHAAVLCRSRWANHELQISGDIKPSCLTLCHGQRASTTFVLAAASFVTLQGGAEANREQQSSVPSRSEIQRLRRLTN